jgi:NAD-dependent SIR2 family protein deacetylase
VTETTHRHQYRVHTHVDGCHFSMSTYVCATCGDVQVRGNERDFNDSADPYSMVWMLDDCPRCQELLKGATPKALS